MGSLHLTGRIARVCVWGGLARSCQPIPDSSETGLKMVYELIEGPSVTRILGRIPLRRARATEREREREGHEPAVAGEDEGPFCKVTVTSSGQPEGAAGCENSGTFQLESCSHRSQLLVKIRPRCVIVVFVENYMTVPGFASGSAFCSNVNK